MSPTQPASTDTLPSPLTLPCGATLENRLAKSALSEGLGDSNNAPGSRLTRLYERWAGSGAGLLITGNVMVDRGQLGEPGNVVVEDERDLDALTKWAAAATSGGAQAWVQINHPGRQTPRYLTPRPVAPSPVAVAGTAGMFAKPRELTGAEIEEIVQRFATTARTVVRAGFTGVQVHGAHGYLVSQFLSPLTNQRTDEWGGTPEKRRRFLLEIVRAIRSEIGAGVPLSVKLNSADFQRGGMTEDESTKVVLALADAGVDLLEVSGGTYQSAAMMGVGNGPVRESTRAREAYFLDYAERIRQATSMPLMLTGGFRSRAAMAEAVDSGAVDVVGLGRPLAIEPELPRQLLSGVTESSTARPRRLGIARVDGLTEVFWYTSQLWRMADGKDPDPNRHPLRNVLQVLSQEGAHGLRRRRRGLTTSPA